MLIEITYNVTDVYMSTTETPVYVEISFEQPGGGAAVWGSITGTLSNQTDLQNALNAKVPYSGATSDVSLGEYGINVGNVIYDTTPTGIPTEQGATYWDTSAETVALIMNGTIQKIGEDTFYHVRNTTGSTIPKGTAVRFSGTTGNSGRLLIAPMLANGTYPSQYYMGITSEELVNNADGKVYHFGKMRNVNTSAFADGDVLYVSPSVAGALTATAPVAPNNIIVAAAVVHANNNGTLMIRTTLGSNINADEGVLITTPTANQGLFYDGSLWVNRSIATALGYTPANAATTLTINGVTYDLSTSRTWTIATGISGSGTSGQVTYWSGSSAVSGSNNLFWDNTNSRLGIGTTTPQARIETFGNTVYVANMMSMYSNVAADESLLYFRRGRGTLTSPLIVSTGDVIGSIRFAVQKSSTVNDVNTNAKIESVVEANGADLRFHTNNSGIANAISEKLRLFGTGNLVLQNGGTFSDGGQRLQVSGDTLLRGSGATSATTALTVQNSSSTNLFVVRNDGNVGIGTNAPANDLTISKTVDGFVRMGITNLSTGGSAFADIVVSNSVGNAVFQITGTGNTTPSVVPNQARFRTSSQIINGFSFVTGTTAPLTFGTNDFIGMTIFGNTRNVVLQNGGTFTDGGQRLQVIGDTLLRGSGATSTTTALTVQNSDSNFILSARNDRRIWIFSNNNITGLTVGDTVGSSIGTNISLGEIRFNTNGFIYHSSTSGASSDLGGVIIKSNSTLNPTVNNPKDLAVGSTFAPTSGTGTYVAEMINPIINQTGGANGITRGLFIAPTLTAAADWRSIEWSNNSGWGLYGAGTANNFIGGALGIGSANLLNTNLAIGKNISGATSAYGVLLDSVVQSGVTSTAYGFRSILTTQASSFTLSSLNHFTASQTTQGAGSIILNQVGFDCGDMNNAYTNIAYRGQINQGTLSWNLYMVGTAKNYLAGNLLIGSTTDNGQRLQVYGDTLLRGSGASSTTFALTVQNSSSTNLFTVRNDGLVNVGSQGGNGFRREGTNQTGYIANGFLVFTTNADNTGKRNLLIGANIVPNYSSILQIDSTTQGFLPPRMTTTEKNAIATPAAGLVVYDTDLAKLCVYTTAWETITSV